MYKLKKYIINFIFVFVCIFVLNGCGTFDNDSPVSAVSVDGKLTVHYIDVGQADSILVRSPNGKNMLIDAGETKDGAVKNYLNSVNVEKLDVIIATHPHNDHISEMADIVKTFDVGTFYMPDATNTSKSFEKMIDAVKEKGVSAVKAKAGMKIDFDENINCNIVAPCSTGYGSLNDYSVVLHMTYGQNSFLFTGDAEELSEKEIIESNYTIKSDVLKAGHHGSRTSTCKEFLDKVDPDIVVISAGLDNDYGHPHEETLEKLQKSGVSIYTTFEDGNIVISSDGKVLTVNGDETDIEISEAEAKIEPQDDEKTAIEQIYIGNNKSKKLHKENCGSLPTENNRVIFSDREAALREGYLPCTKCNP